MMFQDEGRFGRISDPHRCWAPSGIRPDVPQQVVREYTYAFAAISPHDGTLDSLVLPEVNAEMMSLFFEEVSIRHADEFIMMFMDQAGWHRAKELRIPINMGIYWLPPYSPQCNPVEHLWDEMREKWFENKVFHSLNAVEDELVTSLATLEKDNHTVAGLTGFEWIVSISMNAN